MEHELLITGIINHIRSVLWLVSLIVFGVWLYRLSRKYKKPSYAWLIFGLVIVPLTNRIHIGLFYGYLHQWFPNNLPLRFTIHSLYSSLVILVGFIFVFLALSNFANGAVPFSALLSPFRQRDDYDA